MKSDAYIRCMLELALSRLSKQGLDSTEVEQGCNVQVDEQGIEYHLGALSDFSDQLALRLAVMSISYLTHLGTDSPTEQVISKEWHRLEKEFVLGERLSPRKDESQAITKAG